MMKKIKIYTIILTLLAGLGSCEFGDTNVDPAKPLDVSMQAIMPALQTGLSFNLGGEYVLFSNILMQQLDGGSTAQQGDWTRYVIDGQDTDIMWQNTYTNALNMADIIVQKAQESNAPHYSGVAKVMMAAGLGVASDCFGDIPFTTAFEAEQGVIPSYDTHQEIYGDIQSLLDDAISDLSGDSPGGSPAGDDLIFGGDMDSWIAAAWALKARYFLHESNIRGNAAYTDVLNAIANAFSSNSGNMQQMFGTVANEPNPRYEFNLNRPNNVLMGAYFINKLTDKNDPRLANLNGVTGRFYTSIDSPVPYITFAEVKLIEAEALLMTGGDLADVKAALLAGVTASVVEVTENVASETANAEYIANLDAAFDALTTDEERLGLIINEKYVITVSTTVESWVDFRRTGYPDDITPNPQGNTAANPGGGIPRRLPYPDNEITLNNNIPFTEINMQLRLFWDTP